VVDGARTPLAPYKPDLRRNLGYGLFGGLLIGVGFIFLRERSDSSIRTPGSHALQFSVRELGVIPSATVGRALPVANKRRLSLPAAAARLDREEVLDAVELATWNRRASVVAESFRATLTSILMSVQEDRAPRVILVTSPSPREGKSTIVTNLGVALAEIKQRVLVIDADLRRPRIHTIFNQANTWGLVDLLSDSTPCAQYSVDALGRQTHIPGLFTLPSGPVTVDGARLLYSPRMTELLERLRGEFDAVLIDTPPVLSVPDARILSRLVDAVLIVFRAGQTQREAANMALSMFEADGAPVLGTVLNDCQPQYGGYGQYGYGSYYLNEYGPSGGDGHHSFSDGASTR
jgi:capsular exopolysaccharide synthesis family protein